MLMRQAEVAKYERAYRSQNYRLGDKRRHAITTELHRLKRGSLLDVGCGRGEVLAMARQMGFSHVVGVEAVNYLCNGVDVINGMAHALPFEDNAFDIVTMFDVMEHLIPEDTAQVCGELQRVARREILLTVHNGSHVFNGEELHINRMGSYEAWQEFIEYIFAPWQVERLPRHGSISEMFKVTKNG